MHLLTTVFGPDNGTLLWWQMAVRGWVIFLFCALLIRLLCRRAFGMHSYLDIALAVLLGSVLSRAVTGNAPLVGTLAASTAIALCYRTLIHAAQRYRVIGWMVKGRPWVLVLEGRVDAQAMRAVGISRADLEEAAHQASLPDLGHVHTAILERSGRISILPKT